MSWYERLIPSRIRKTTSAKVPEGLWTKCSSCETVLYAPDLKKNQQVCSQCGCHMYLSARDRIASFLDPDSGKHEIGTAIMPIDFLRFKDKKRYKDRLSQAQSTVKENDALVVVEGRLEGKLMVVCAFEFHFIGGSMGSVVGERFVRGVRHCLKHNIPMVCFSASGGARMQEALTSLFQMAKTSAALAKMQEQGLPFISVLTHPTMGGVSASLAMLGDIIIAEPKALIGFAGPRVIQQTTRSELPEGFQKSEFLLEHGAIDMIIARHELRPRISNMLSLLSPAESSLNA